MVSTVVKENVKLMISGGERGMRRFASSESQGGNAGVSENGIMVGVIFCFESVTGKIIEFTNEGEIRYSQGIFRLLFKDVDADSVHGLEKKRIYPRVVSCRITPGGLWGKQATPLAEAVIQESVKLYT